MARGSTTDEIENGALGLACLLCLLAPPATLVSSFGTPLQETGRALDGGEPAAAGRAQLYREAVATTADVIQHRALSALLVAP